MTNHKNCNFQEQNPFIHDVSDCGNPDIKLVIVGIIICS